MKSPYKRIHPLIKQEPYESQAKAKRHNPSLMVTHWGKDFILGAGTSDRCYFWTYQQRLLVLSTNRRHGYAGLEEFGPDGRDTMFDQSVDEEFFNHSPAFQRDMLAQHL
jgi:hypothetical protein